MGPLKKKEGRGGWPTSSSTAAAISGHLWSSLGISGYNLGCLEVRPRQELRQQSHPHVERAGEGRGGGTGAALSAVGAARRPAAHPARPRPSSERRPASRLDDEHGARGACNRSGVRQQRRLANARVSLDENEPAWPPVGEPAHSCGREGELSSPLFGSAACRRAGRWRARAAPAPPLARQAAPAPLGAPPPGAPPPPPQARRSCPPHPPRPRPRPPTPPPTRQRKKRPGHETSRQTRDHRRRPRPACHRSACGGARRPSLHSPSGAPEPPSLSCLRRWPPRPSPPPRRATTQPVASSERASPSPRRARTARSASRRASPLEWRSGWPWERPCRRRAGPTSPGGRVVDA